MSEDRFILKSNYQPTGDQPQAIDAIVRSIESGAKEQTLLGVTGSGKTLTSFKSARLASKLDYIDKVLFDTLTVTVAVCQFHIGLTISPTGFLN